MCRQEITVGSKIKDLKKQVEYYANLSYTTTVVQQDDGHGIYYLARVIELPGLMMTGDTPAEAFADLESVKREWIETNLRLGNKMPEPVHSPQYSGKVVLRMPPSLHETLVTVAELEGVSLNQYMVYTLSKSAGRDEVLIKERKAPYRK
ncbi:MAG: type II toxin-antitoxin system HicB family antitoxin [Dehalococcoidia bacterium]|nr:MAG: type II toxin-antitoxin system HicB family antitoxin [Dehalococcoidia bacterium]